MKFLPTFFVFLLFTVIGTVVASDSLGVAGRYLLTKLSPYGIGPTEIVAIMTGVVTLVGAGLRAMQRYLQGRTTIWKFANNRLTTSLINRLLGWAFGKTTLIYESKIVCDEKDRPTAIAAAATLTAKHLMRKNGSDMLKAFADAVGKK